jgi:hypothetical protein
MQKTICTTVVAVLMSAMLVAPAFAQEKKGLFR